MTAASVTLIVQCAPDEAEPLVAALAAHAVVAQATPRLSLDGAVATSWLVVAGIGLRAAPEILRRVSEFLTRDRVESIEIDGLVVKNPRADDVRKIIDHFVARQASDQAADPDPTRSGDDAGQTDDVHNSDHVDHADVADQADDAHNADHADQADDAG